MAVLSGDGVSQTRVAMVASGRKEGTKEVSSERANFDLRTSIRTSNGAKHGPIHVLVLIVAFELFPGYAGVQ